MRDISSMNPIAVNTLGRLSGFLPFSLAEMLIYLLILLLVVWIVRSIVKGVRRTGAGKYMLNRGAVLLLIAAVLFFLYEANQDVPFSQPSFSERYGLSSGSYSTENLAATGRMLIQNINARAGSVSRDENEIMTVHTAKGMEYPCVFLCGLNEGVFPSRKVLMPDDMDEERRLAYVAMTRAKDRLYLSDSEGVTNDGVFKYPSRFIFEAGLENIECVTEPDREIVERSTRFIRQDEEKLEKRRNLFEEGSRVRHENSLNTNRVYDIRII